MDSDQKVVNKELSLSHVFKLTKLTCAQIPAESFGVTVSNRLGSVTHHVGILVLGPLQDLVYEPQVKQTRILRQNLVYEPQAKPRMRASGTRIYTNLRRPCASSSSGLRKTSYTSLRCPYISSYTSLRYPYIQNLVYEPQVPVYNLVYEPQVPVYIRS